MVCDYDRSIMTSEVASTSNYVNEVQTEENRTSSSLSSPLTYRVDPDQSVLVALVQQAKWSDSETSLSGDSAGACDIDYTKIGPPDDDEEGCNSVDLEEIIIDPIVNACADEPDPQEEEEPPQEKDEEQEEGNAVKSVEGSNECTRDIDDIKIMMKRKNKEVKEKLEVIVRLIAKKKKMESIVRKLEAETQSRIENNEKDTIELYEIATSEYTKVLKQNEDLKRMKEELSLEVLGEEEMLKQGIRDYEFVKDEHDEVKAEVDKLIEEDKDSAKQLESFETIWKKKKAEGQRRLEDLYGEYVSKFAEMDESLFQVKQRMLQVSLDIVLMERESQ